MQLIYKEKPSGFTGKGETPVISWWDKAFCCAKMKEMWEEKRWGEGRIGVDETGLVADKQAVSLHFTDCHEDDAEHINEPITHCPFCGQVIECIKGVRV